MSWLAFADQKIQEVVTLATGLREGDAAIGGQLEEYRAAAESRRKNPGVRVDAVRQRTGSVSEADRTRGEYEARREAQAEAPAAPDAPTRPPRFDALSRTSGADAIGQHLYPLLCVSMYEHAWLGDYGFWGKERYMTHFWDCVNWERVERLWGDDRT